MNATFMAVSRMCISLLNRVPILALAFASGLSCPAVTAAQEAAGPMTSAVDPSTITYPNTDRGDVVENQFGEDIADPYRWLEKDVREDTRVAEWVAAQNQVTQAYLDTLPQRGWFGLDPTNRQVVDDRYVMVATGRDYEDVAPIRGAFYGSGHRSLEVGVDVRRVG